MSKQMMVTIAIFLYLFICSFFIEPNSLGVTKYQIEDTALAGIRVVFASDFHLKPKDFNKLDNVVKLINLQNPDIVLLGGDYLTGHDPKKTMRPTAVADKLGMLKGQKFAVFGENDYWSAGDELLAAFRADRIMVLRNQSIKTAVRGRYVTIIGIDDATTQEASPFKAYMNTQAPRILISHNPDIYYDISGDVNLAIAGHTHGGQFVFPFSPPLFVPSKYGTQFASGLVKPGRAQMIISKGIGTSFLPVRFNCKPEIVVIDFIIPGTAPDKKNNKKR